MTARKTPKPRMVATEGSFGTAFQPPQARSGMMKVAGASDDDPDMKGEELITDDEELALESTTIRLSLGQLREMVRRIARRG